MVKDNVSIGLDIGQRHINMVKLRPEGQQELRLLDFTSVALNSGESKEDKLRQLKNIVQEKGIAGSSVNIGISGEPVIIRYINLPNMSKEEVAQALKYEAQQYIPFKMEEVIFDYQILESVDNKIKVLLAAAKKQAVIEFVEFIKQAELRPKLLDVNAFSLINCFQINGPQIKESDVFALVNLGFDLVNIDILQGETPLFFRDISILEDFLSLRREGETEFFETIRPLLLNLIREIRVSIDYYESEFEKQVGTIYLSGEGARIAELIEFFNSQLGREVKAWNPLQNLTVDSARIDAQALNEVSSMLALACGLALREAKR